MMLAVLQLLAKAGPGARNCLFCDDGASDSNNTSPASASIADNASLASTITQASPA